MRRVVRLDGRLQELSRYDRRLVLAVRAQVRWGTAAVLWPPSATSWAQVDLEWYADVVRHYLLVQGMPVDEPTRLASLLVEAAA